MDGDHTPELNDEQAGAEALASFNAGFSGTETPTPQTPPETPPAASEQVQQAQPFSVSKADWDALSDRLKAFDETHRRIDSLAGNLGGMKQQLETLRNSRAQITPERLKRLTGDYPELAKSLAEDLSEILSAPASAGVDQEAVDRMVDARLSKAQVEVEKKLLRTQHPDWIDVLRSDAFKAYQLTITPEENAKLMASSDSDVVGDHLTKFKKLQADAAKLRTPASNKPAPTATPKPTPSPRTSRLEAAVPAKGGGGAPPAPDPADDFNAGYSLKGRA